MIFARNFVPLLLSLSCLLTACSNTPNQQTQNEPPNNGAVPPLPEKLPELPNFNPDGFSTKANASWILMNGRWIYFSGTMIRDYFLYYMPGEGWKWGPNACYHLRQGC